MSTYYLHDGRNEVGPFTIDLLKQQKLTRNTPVRKRDTNSWMPAEKLDVLKEVVAPKKIRRPKDVIPVVKEKFVDLQKRKPGILYGTLLGLGLLGGFSLFSIDTTAVREIPKEVQPVKEVIQPAPALAVEEVVPVSQPAAPKRKVSVPVVKEDKEKATRLRWNKLITATNSNYGIGLLGGIKDLNVIITNRTNYPIEEAVAKITYIKANGSIWKTKLVSVYDIPEHDSKEQSVPDVGRGKKVKVTIEKIVSKKMKFSYTEGQEINTPGDPYVMQ